MKERQRGARGLAVMREDSRQKDGKYRGGGEGVFSVFMIFLSFSFVFSFFFVRLFSSFLVLVLSD